MQDILVYVPYQDTSLPLLSSGKKYLYRKSFLQVNQEYIVGILREIFIIVHSNARISSCKHQDHPTALRYTELKFDWLSNRLGQSHSFSERASWRQLGRGKPTSRKLSMEESAE